MNRSRVLLAVVMLCVGCGESNQVAPSQTANSSGAARFVTIGFWNDSTCSGAPVNTNQFPVDYGDTKCYSWPGRSGTNSASRFTCGPGTFSYTQWTTLTCSGGQNPEGTRKTDNLTGCTQDVPPTLYARILDFSGCTTP